MTSSHFDLSDEAFLEAFNNTSLAPELFTHEAHLRLAWLLLNQQGLERALGNIPKAIKQYVAALGAEDKYHETLTIAAVYIVQHFRQRSNEADFTDFIKEFPRLKNNFKDLLKSHYSDKIINSSQAKDVYLSPDLLTFD